VPRKPKPPIRVSLSDEAQGDFEAAVEWYLEELAFAAADDFADEFDRALALLLQFPDLGVSGRHKTRLFTLQNFPYPDIPSRARAHSRHRGSPPQPPPGVLGESALNRYLIQMNHTALARGGTSSGRLKWH
jgi:plasmid stabilization system protein ParE